MTGEEKRALRVQVDLSRLRRVSVRELAVRFLFGAAISAGAGLAGIRFGHVAGGLFLAFPAILPASLTLIEDKDGKQRARVSAMGAVLGALALAAFAGSAAWLLPWAPPAFALGAAIAAWLAGATALYFVAALLLERRGRDPAAPDRSGSLHHGQTG